MKQHLVTIMYKLPNPANYYMNTSYTGRHLIFMGLVDEVIGDNGKAIIYPCGLFKQAFGFNLPEHSVINLI